MALIVRCSMLVAVFACAGCEAEGGHSAAILGRCVNSSGEIVIVTAMTRPSVGSEPVAPPCPVPAGHLFAALMPRDAP